MHDVHHTIVEVNVVIGVLVVHCELLVVRVVPIVVCDDAVVRRTLVLIAFHRSLCFGRSHFSKNFAVLEVYYLQVKPRRSETSTQSITSHTFGKTVCHHATCIHPSPCRADLIRFFLVTLHQE